MLKLSRLLVLAAGVSLLLLSVADAQMTKKPMSVEDIEYLLQQRVTPRRVATLVEEQGVKFEITPTIRERLAKAGADEQVLLAVERAGIAYARQQLEEMQKAEDVKKAKEERQRQTGEMVSVPAGKFYMGCNEQVDSECNSNEKPGRWVYVDAIRIDKTEVTVAAYRRCVQAGRCSSEGLTSGILGECNWDRGDRENHPLNCVTWEQAQAYCEWAGKRLPTEAEWEKAARGTDGRKYPWGNSGYGAGGRVANIPDETAKRRWPNWPIAQGYDDGYFATAPVGSFPAGASPYGTLDMVGNVWEWVQGWYGADYYRQGPNRNPTGPDSGQSRVLRGGSWNLVRRHDRASSRAGDAPGSRHDPGGFRCAQ